MITIPRLAAALCLIATGLVPALTSASDAAPASPYASEWPPSTATLTSSELSERAAKSSAVMRRRNA